MGLPEVFPEGRQMECIATSLAVLALSVALALRLLPFCGPFCAWAGQCARDVGRRAKARSQGGARMDALEQRIQDEVGRRQLERAHALLDLLTLSFLVAGARTLWGLTANMEEMPDVPTGAVVSFVAMAACSSLASLFRRSLLKAWTLDVIYSLLMAGLLIWAAFFEARALSVRIPAILTMAFLLSLFNLRLWLNFGWVAALACTTTAKVALAGGPFFSVFYPFALMLAALAWISHCLAASVRLEILAGDRGDHLTAVQRLLGTICDVVVELDGGLRMLQHSPKLADVLLRGGGRSLAGVRLQDFMPEEADRESFARHMNDLDETGAGGGVFHAKMRDSMNGTISMEFFSVAFRGSDACQRHILGMREFTDIAPVAHLEQRAPPPVEWELPREGATPPLRGTPRALEQGDIRSHSRSSGRSSGSTSPRSESASEASDSGSVRSGGLQVETKYMARKVSMAYVLCSWHFTTPGGACCPWHRVVAEAQRVVDAMRADSCKPRYACVEGWQCKRCGIAAPEYRDETHRRRCKLCKAIKRAALDLEAGTA